MAVSDLRSPTTHADAYGNDVNFTSRFRVSFATNNLTTSDQGVIWAIPAGTRINWTACKTITGETGLFDLGDYSDITTPTAINADGWLDGMDIGTTGNVGDTSSLADAASEAADSTAAVGAYANGKTYLTAAYLLINNLTANLDSGVVDIYVNHSRVDTSL